MAIQNVKFAGETAVNALATEINKKLTKVSSMPESPTLNTIVLYIGATSSSYIQGHIYQWNGTQWNRIDLENDKQNINLSVPLEMLSGTKLTVESALSGLNTEKPSPVELTQAQYDALSTAEKNDRSKIYYVIDGASGNTEWGSIEGTLSNQTDLNTALNNKCDNSVIAPVESDATASQAYAIGEHFIRDGAFCTAKTAIAQGTSFTLNTNYTASTIGNACIMIDFKSVVLSDLYWMTSGAGKYYANTEYDATGKTICAVTLMDWSGIRDTDNLLPYINNSGGVSLISNTKTFYATTSALHLRIVYIK